MATGHQGLDDLDITTKGKVYDLLATIYPTHGGLTQNYHSQWVHKDFIFYTPF